MSERPSWRIRTRGNGLRPARAWRAPRVRRAIWTTSHAALRAIATSGEVVEGAHSQHGQKYVVDGWLSAHTEQNWERLVRTVWIIDEGHQAPRLVTAYPGKE